MTPAGLQAIGYVRVSTREQGDSGHGLDAQETAIRDACARRGWQLVSIERDVISSRRKSRPGLEAAMRQARESGGVLVAAKASRVARSTMELLAFHARADEQGWHLVTLDMEHIDTTTPIGKMIRTVLAAFNEFEREMISERTREAMAAAKAKGVKLGRPRGIEALDRKHEDPERRKRAELEHARMAVAIPVLRELRANGLSISRIADEMNERGIPGAHGGRWHKRNTHLALQRYGGK